MTFARRIPKSGGCAQSIVHRPGLEHSRLTPTNRPRTCSSTTCIWVKPCRSRARRVRGRVMRERGVEVFDLPEPLLTETLARSRRHASGCATTCSTNGSIGTAAARAPHSADALAGPPRSRTSLIGGITKCGRPPGLDGLRLGVDQARPASSLPPLPELHVHSATPPCWVFGGVTLNPMAKPARNPRDPRSSKRSTASTRCSPPEALPVWLPRHRRNWGRAHHRGRRRR